MAGTFVAKQSYYVQKTPRAVFDALIDPKVLVKWFLSGAQLDPKKGGSFGFDWIGGYHMDGQVLEITRGRSVSFLWVDRLPNGKMVKTRASFRVTAKGRGTVLSLRHSGFTVPEHFAECASRWAYYLTNLKSVLEHGKDLRSKWDW